MSRRPPFPSPGHAEHSACACVSVKHTAVCGTCVSSEVPAAPGTARPGTIGPSWVKEVRRQEGLLRPRPHSSFPVSQAEVQFDLSSLTGLLVGERHRGTLHCPEPSACVCMCDLVQGVPTSPDRLHRPLLRPASTRSPGPPTEDRSAVGARGPAPLRAAPHRWALVFPPVSAPRAGTPWAWTH